MVRSRYLVAVVYAIFFTISLITNILGPIIPDIIRSYHLSLFTAALLPFSFFIGYGILSIPAGFLVEKWGEKAVIAGAFCVALFGSVLFGLLHVYGIAITSLFLIGCSMAAIQVAINPLLRVAGGEEHFAFNSAFAQFVFGAASFVSPFLFSWIVLNFGRSAWLTPLTRVVPAGMQWISMYWIFALVLTAIIVVVALSRFPKVKRTQEESAGTLGMYRSLAAKPAVWLYFLSIFFYVGSEQGTANWISEFLKNYHGYNPDTTGAAAVAWFWGLLTLGCLAGMALLKLFDSRTVLRAFGIGALVCLSGALFAPAPYSKLCFPCVGLCASVMWPIVMSLALNSVAEHHGPFAGILCTAIMGGAVLPLAIGRIADAAGLRLGMCLLYFSFGWVMATSFWAKPIVVNETVRRKQLQVQPRAEAAE
jgi:MFS transporter, FHS family, L-fucose permease